MRRSPAMAVSVWIVALGVLAWLLARPPAPNLIFGRYGHLRFMALLTGGYALGWALYLWQGRTPLREKLIRLVLTSASLLIPLGLVEATAALGLVDYARVLPGGGRIPVGYSSLNPKWWRLDPELIHMRYPHQRIRGDTFGDIRAVPNGDKRTYTMEIDYDANGFRNGSDPERAVVVLIGDSFVEAGLVGERATVAALLERELGREVANLGITMYGPQQELAVLRRYGLPLEPGVVAWFFFEGNDLHDANRYDDHRRAIERRFADYDRYHRRSLLINLSHLLAEWTAPRPAGRRFARSCEVDAGGDRQRIYFRYGAGSLAPEEGTGLRDTQRAIEAAYELTTGQGARFVLVYVPTKYRVYRDHCVDAGPGNFPADWQPDDLPDRLRRWSGSLGVPFLDLSPVLRERAVRDGLLYFPDDSHWTPLGNREVAQALLEFLRQRDWIGSKDSAGP